MKLTTLAIAVLVIGAVALPGLASAQAPGSILAHCTLVNNTAYICYDVLGGFVSFCILTQAVVRLMDMLGMPNCF